MASHSGDVMQAQLEGQLAQPLPVHQLGTHLGKHTFGFRGVLMAQEISDYQAQHRIAEKFKALIVLPPADGRNLGGGFVKQSFTE